MKKLIKKQIQEIREWRGSYRPFHAVPENVSAFEEQEKLMVEYIDLLLEIIDGLSE